MVTLHTNFGDIKLDLNAEKAPKTVANFIKYAQSGHYDNTIFHRIIEGFMIQGGGFAAGMEEKPTNKPIKNEANSGLSNTKYSVSMARTMEPHSASAQFFINLNDNTFLDFKSETTDGWGYCVFAQVVEGFDVVDKMKNVATGNSGYVHQDVPLEDVVITSVTIV
ncbi:peptidylprolyl isomerase [Psychromonas sp. MB-3u-54]|uniref:peptidylprolyl isomerase n=1 Tax=Psychromonas sp. MB-3u-54 TaxID=2058319 RepID=UPI000C34DB6D|nr:peptidylprolyl isomerase [Psychromonas sp. MB-3u-54]PKH01656.1 peptidylprolyl isomerase [Psychromonas sp. MB-3u-54]